MRDIITFIISEVKDNLRDLLPLRTYLGKAAGKVFISVRAAVWRALFFLLYNIL